MNPQRILRRVQHDLERYYELERAPSVCDFVVWTDQRREAVLVRETSAGLDIAVTLPRTSDEQPAYGHDELLQLVEGVSHFLYLSERARTDLPTTHLELELQAEVDKFVIFGLARRRPGARPEKARARRVHDALYGRVQYLHPVGTELGDRYRFANALAARMTQRVIDRDDPTVAHGLLRRFYRAGQAEKIRVATTGFR